MFFIFKNQNIKHTYYTNIYSQLFAVRTANLLHLPPIIDVHQNVVDEQVLLEELVAAAHHIAVHVVLLLIVGLHPMERLERFAA